MVCHCSLICIFLMTNDAEHLFIVLVGCLCVFLRGLFKPFLQFLIKLGLLLSCRGSFYILAVNPFSGIHDLQIFSPILCVPFYSVDSIL